MVGAGKAAAAMAQAVERHFADQVSGVVVTRYRAQIACEHIRVYEAAHPIADAASVTGAEAILDAVKDLTADDLVVALISGGGSALISLPVEGVSLAEKQSLIDGMMRRGAPIALLNRVRIALSRIKGGGLREAIGSARCLSLIISDVVGDDPALIASGPTVSPPPWEESLLDQIAPYAPGLSPELRHHFEQPLSHRPWPAANSHDAIALIASPAMALQAAERMARRIGLMPIVLGDSIEGCPARAAKLHLDAWRNAAPGSVILSGGELTTRVRGQGKGGPNLEFALEILRQAGPEEPIWGLACDTDGCDGNSEAAGALIAPNSRVRAYALGLNIDQHLAQSDSFTFFNALGDIVETGPTQTNVNDFRALLKL